MDDRVALRGFQHRHLARFPLEAQARQVRRLDLADRLAGEDVPEYILELADVARPGVALQDPDDLEAEPHRPLGRQLAQDRQRDVANLIVAVSQRGHPGDLVEVT